MKKILICLFISCFVLNARAEVISMFGKKEYGYNLPKYNEEYPLSATDNSINIYALADSNNFPISSIDQGSVFNKIFLDLYDVTRIKLWINYRPESYSETVSLFERGDKSTLKSIAARLGVYYEEYPYSKNEFIYPSFFENRIFVISSSENRLNIQNKNDLKNYQGVYVKKDYLPKNLLKDFENLQMTEAETFPKAYELLLTKKADFVVASYYQSLIEAYKLGIREYITYSKTPLLKAPMFIRVIPALKRHPRIVKLREYLKSERYKKVREEAFQELVEIYKENTRGVVPPTYEAVAEENPKQEE